MNHLSKENVEEVLGLSPLQEDLSTRESSQQPSPGNFTQSTYQLEGAIDAALFQSAWSQVVLLHAALRTLFRPVRNRTVQVVLLNMPLPVEIHDLSSLSAEEQQREIATLARVQREPFDLAGGPLLRLALMRRSERETFLLWTYHQIVLDAQSETSILADLLSGYNALLCGRPFPPLKQSSSREYLKWVSRQDWTSARAFWSAQLAGIEEPTPLVTNHFQTEQQSAQQSEQQITRRVQLPIQLAHRLNALSARYTVSNTALVQAAWAILLSIYTHETDVIFGSVHPGRPAELLTDARMPGRFTNTLPQRIRLEGSQKLPTFLQMVQKQHEQLTNYAYMPISEVQAYSELATNLPLFTSSLAVQAGSEIFTREASALALQGCLSRQSSTARCALEITVTDTWEIVITHAAEPSAVTRFERLLTHFQTLFTSMTQQPEAPLAALSVLDEQERTRLLVDFNQSGPQPELDLLAHQAIARQAALHPTAVAAVDGDEQITYQDLDNRANQMAHWLRTQNVKKDVLVAICAERSIALLVALLATMKAGGAYVPLDPQYPDARLQTILIESQPTVIIADCRQVERSMELSGALASPPAFLCLNSNACTHQFAEASCQSFPLDAPEEVAGGDALANVFFTSGSTGTPKGAMIEHGGMLNHLHAKIQLTGLSQESIVAQSASHCFDISVWQFLAPLMVGGRTMIYGTEIAGDPQALLAALQRDGVTVLEIVPTMTDLLLQAAADSGQGADELPDLQFLISTGEALTASLCRRWLLTYPHVSVVNAYGATECSDDTTHAVITTAPADDQAYMTVGRPIPRIGVYILGRWQQPVPIGCTGEIHFTGMGVGRGYVHNPEQTAQAFVANTMQDGKSAQMYRTGDLGYFLPDGHLVYLKRLDEQVKVRGHRIELHEIEAVLLRHAAVAQCVVIARPDAQGENTLLAYVVAQKQGDLSALQAFLQSQLPEYMVPRQIQRMERLPLNRNGKVDRKALPEISTASTSALPENPTEVRLALIWQEVLSLSQVGIDETFFELGGHSLKLIQVRARIRQQMGISLDLRTLFTYQTIRELATLLEHHPSLAEAAEQASIPCLPAKASYPLSRAQQRLWFLQQLAPQSCFYNMPVFLAAEGHFQRSAFIQALQTMVDRHASLRTTFPIVEGMPVQRVAAQLPLTCSMEDLSAWDERARQEQIASIIQTETQTCFNLETGPLFRAQLIRLHAEHHLLLFNLHHIIGDAWSWQIFEREFTSLYQAALDHRPHSLPPLSVQYSDYASWQNERLNRQQLVEQERYWDQQLANRPATLNLPTDHPRPAVQTYAGCTQSWTLDATLFARIKLLAQRSDTTLFMLLLAAVGVLLARLSAQEDLIIGTPATGRDRVELENLIGFFINMLPLRLDLSGHPTFLSLLERTKKVALDAYTHQEYPFDLLVDRLQPERDLGRSPIFSVMFQVNRATSEEGMAGLALKSHPLQTRYSRFDLTIAFSETDRSIDCQIEYNTDLFEAATISSMQGHLCTLLESIVADPEQPITSLHLLSAGERHQALNAWNNTAMDYPRQQGLQQLIEAQAERVPEKIAVRSKQGTLTYRALNARANQLARYLQRLGVGTETLVALCVERSPAMLVALLGILKAGGAYVPLDITHPPERLAFILRDAQISLILTQQAWLERLPEQENSVLCLDTDWAKIALERPEKPDEQHGGENLAYVIYTSGSTGQPKGVQVLHRSVSNIIHSMSKQPGICEHDTFFALTTLSFDIATLELFWPLSVGACVVMASEGAADVQLLQAELQESGATLMQATPSVWRHLLNNGWSNEGQITMLCGGEALTPELAGQLQAQGAPLWNVYGPTETTIWSTISRVEAGAGSCISIGRPIANTQTYILDSSLQLVPPGVTGDLYIGGDGLARGYLNRPQLTAERFIAHSFHRGIQTRLYKTGDLARYLPDGSIEYLGRSDFQVKIRGFRIELAEVEAALRTFPTLRETVVTATHDTSGNTSLTAYLVVDPHAPVPEALALRSHLKKLVPEYMVPTAFLRLDAFPVTPHGKIDRQRLPQPERSARPEPGDTYVAPRDFLEAKIIRLWEEILHVQPIGVFDNFFTLGGHSLAAAILIRAMGQHLRLTLPLIVLFQNPTPAQICEYLRTHISSALQSHPGLILLQDGNASKPLFLIHPQGGDVMCYRQLVQALGKERTIYGLEDPDGTVPEAPFTTIAHMARSYARQIRQVAPHGPYYLAGWSFGGLVAFEIARYLEEEGEELALLALLDTYLPQGLEVPENQKARPASTLVDLASDILDMQKALFDTLNEEESLALALQRAKELELLPGNATVEMMRQQIRIMARNQKLMDSYQCTGSIRTVIHVFQATEAQSTHPEVLLDPQVWQPHTAGGIQVIPVSGSHQHLTRPPHVFVVAEAMNSMVAEAESRTTALSSPERERWTARR